MGIYEEIKNIRQKAGMTQKEFAKKLKVSDPYLIMLERVPMRKGGKGPIPSEDLLKRLARIASKDESERALIEKSLMQERANLQFSKIYKNKNGHELGADVVRGGMMPLEFIKRLKNDVKWLDGSVDKLEQGEVSSREIEMVADGQMLLTRKQVISLAMQLNQSVEEYLLLADYMPDSIKEVMAQTGKNLDVFFRKLSRIPPESVNKMVDVLDKIYNMFWEEEDENNKT